MNPMERQSREKRFIVILDLGWHGFNIRTGIVSLPLKMFFLVGILDNLMGICLGF